MDDAFLVGVLDRPANLREKPQALRRGQVPLVAVISNPLTRYQFHHEKRTAALRGAGIEYLGNIGVVHERQSLSFGFKPGDDLPGIHAQLDDLEGDPAADGFLLLGHIDHPAPAFANLLQELVAPNPLAGLVGRSDLHCGWKWRRSRAFHERSRRLVGAQESLHALAQSSIACTGPLQKCRTLLFGQIEGGIEDSSGRLLGLAHIIDRHSSKRNPDWKSV